MITRMELRASPCYIAVVAARNEERFIGHSIRSVLNQTIPPRVCVLSDDGSSDRTPFVAAEEGAEVLYYEKPRSNMRGINQAYAIIAGVLEASYEVPDWEYLLKFDGDTIIPPNYVKHLITKMEKDPGLGICSGMPYNEKIRLARASDAAKLYRRECWDDIKGLDVFHAFDSHALLKAAQAGWRTRTIPTASFREMRSSRKYGLSRWVFTGFARASFGLPLYHTVFAAAKNIRWGWPPILNFFTTIFAHILSNWPQAPNLEREWVRRYAISEVTTYMREIWKLFKDKTRAKTIVKSHSAQ
jgi:glycosyltransferase involved in cell wall biosynthesis